jgi:Niemann-Pick C2 protein
MAKISDFILTVLLFVTFTKAGKVDFEDCGSKLGKISEVDVSGCTTLPCSLPRGSTVKFEVTFEPNTNVSAATAVVHGILAGIPIPFPIPNPDGCKDSGLTCPLSAGKSYTYSTDLPVKTMYPSVKVIVKWELKSNDDIFCMQIPVQITSSRNATPKKMISNRTKDRIGNGNRMLRKMFQQL